MIPKPGGGERPLGIPTIRDRVVQTAAKLVLEPIFEADLEPSAYGYRPRRSASDAIRLVHQLLQQGYTDVVDADLTKYFDTVSQDWLIRFLEHRIGDRGPSAHGLDPWGIIRLVRKWLRAGILEEEIVSVSDEGTGQGSVISPLLANVYLHYVLDLRAKRWRRGLQPTGLSRGGKPPVT